MTTISGHTFDESLLPLEPRVLDVGSRNFAFAVGVRAIRTKAEVLCLEPDPGVESRPDMRLLHAAMVGDGRKRGLYAVCGTGEGNFILNEWRPRSDVGYARPVECVDIRDITDATRVEKWDLVKLDCEGSEFGILEHWPLGGIAGQITVEFHDFTNHARWNDEYFTWLWTQLPDYEVVQHEFFKQGEAWGHWDTLLVRKEGK